VSDFFDSSVLVAALSEDDVAHPESLKAWKNAQPPILYAHALLETFSTLTGRRHPAQLTADEAILVISRNLERAEPKLVEIPPQEIIDLLHIARQSGVRGGAAYDYMHLCAARKSGASRIFTLNKRHFTAIAPDLSPIIFHPTEIY